MVSSFILKHVQVLLEVYIMKSKHIHAKIKTCIFERMQIKRNPCTSVVNANYQSLILSLFKEKFMEAIVLYVVRLLVKCNEKNVSMLNRHANHFDSNRKMLTYYF